jgi:hypothetical protein
LSHSGGTRLPGKVTHTGYGAPLETDACPRGHGVQVLTFPPPGEIIGRGPNLLGKQRVSAKGMGIETSSLRMIGQTVWITNQAFSHTRDPERGYTARTIVGETSRSWILDGWGKEKIPKKGDGYTRLMPKTAYGQETVYLRREDVDARIWIEKHSHSIAEKVGQLRYREGGINLLKEIAKLVDYKE